MTAASADPVAFATQNSQQQPLRGVLVGAGYFAGFHAEAWTRMPSAHLVGVVDLDAARAERFAQRHGVTESGSDLRKLVDRLRPDFIDVVTRPDARAKVVAEAARLRVPVLCQKPLADSWEEALQLVQLCEAAGTRLIVHENWRFQPWYRECAQIVAAGGIGQPHFVSMRMRTADGRGPMPYEVQPYFRTMKRLLIHETGVHFIDTFRYLMGDIAQVSCRIARVNPAIEGEDAAWIHLGFAGGGFGHVDANRITGPVPNPLTLGELSLEGEEGCLRVAGDGRIWVRSGSTAAEILHPFVPESRGYKGDSVLAFQEHAVAALRSGVAAETEGRSYLDSVAAAFACYRSAEEDRVVSPREIFES